MTVCMQDVVLCVKMGEGLVGEAATRGESLCTQQTTGKHIMPAFESVLGIQHARSCLIQPIRFATPCTLLCACRDGCPLQVMWAHTAKGKVTSCVGCLLHVHLMLRLSVKTCLAVSMLISISGAFCAGLTRIRFLHQTFRQAPLLCLATVTA